MPVSSFAENICFSETTAGSIVVELEQARILEQENGLLKEGNAELEKRIELLGKIIDLKDKQLQTEEQALDRYSGLLKDEQKACDEAIKKAKPSFFKTVGNILTGVGIGALVAIGVLGL